MKTISVMIVALVEDTSEGGFHNDDRQVMTHNSIPFLLKSDPNKVKLTQKQNDTEVPAESIWYMPSKSLQ